MANAIAVARKRLGGAPLFIHTPRDRIHLRHHGLARLLGGPRNPGLPTGGYIEINGREGAGKTTTIMALVAGVINRTPGTHKILCNDGKIREFPLPRKAAILDFEQTFDTTYGKAAIPNAEFLDVDRATGEAKNIDTANVFLHQPTIMEDGIELGIALIESAEIGILVIDSVPAMLPQEEADKPMGDATMGLLARSMGKMFRKTIGTVSRHGVVVVLVNQWRNKIGIQFGDPRSSPGGEAAKYFDSIRIDVSGANADPWFPDAGKLCTIKTSKNKVSGYRGQATYHLGTGIGLSAEAELTEALADIDVVTSPGVNAKVSVRLDGKKTTFPNRAAWVTWLREGDRFDKLQRIAIARGAPFADQATPAAMGMQNHGFGAKDD